MSRWLLVLGIVACLPAAAPAADCWSFNLTPESMKAFDLRSRSVDAALLAELSAWELRVLRNAVYAVHGRPFKDPELRDFFLRMAWCWEDSHYSDDLLSAVARANVVTIQAAEKAAIEREKAPAHLGTSDGPELPRGTVFCSRQEGLALWLVPYAALPDLDRRLPGWFAMRPPWLRVGEWEWVWDLSEGQSSLEDEQHVEIALTRGVTGWLVRTGLFTPSL